MKISTRLIATGLACAGAALLIGVALFASTARVNADLKKNRAAADVVQAVAGLRYLTLEYAREPGERVRVQWGLRNQSLGELLGRPHGFESPEEQGRLASILDGQRDVAAVFAELVDAQQARQLPGGDREILDELISRLTGAISNKANLMMAEAIHLQDSSREAVAAAQGQAMLIIFTLSSVMVLVVGLGIFLVFRSIARPLARLSAGVKEVGGGDLQHSIGITTQDELGDLARSFDGMTLRLRNTMVSLDRLAQSEERTRLILDTALDAVVSMDDRGVITGWNPQAEVIFGWTRDESIGRYLSETIVPPNQREDHARGLQRYLATGVAAVLNKRIELTALHRDGHEFPIELSITPIRSGPELAFSAFLRDITERKHAEIRVQAQLARLSLLGQITRAIGERQDLKSIFQVAIRSIEDQLPADFSCICLHEPANNSLVVMGVGVASAALAMELAMSEHAQIVIDENGLSRCMRGEVVYEADVGKVGFPFPQRLAAGGLRALVVAPLLVESWVFGVVVTARRRPDSFSSGECEFLQQVSEHVALAAHQAQLHDALQQAYNDLRQTQQVAVQQERLRALGQMASGIAHDINNAISPVVLYTESLLETESNLSERARNYLGVIQQSIDDVAQTVARMREFYRQREPQLDMVTVDLNSLIEEVLVLTKARWGDMSQRRGVMIDARVEPLSGLPLATGVESEIREALINLVFNAVDAMPEGGTLVLRTKMIESGSNERIGDPLRTACVEVTDTGTGMDEDTRRRCLEPFFTTKGERGTGLGLAMVYGMVQRHGGELELESAYGKGTTVRLSFPIATQSCSKQGRDDRSPAPRSRLKILTVDDDPLLLKALRDALEADGHFVTFANGGQEGIDLFHSALDRGQAFSVVITDLGMPRVDGRKVASAVKTVSPSTPVILLTGWGQRMTDDGDIPLFVDHVLGKPPKTSQLRETIAICCRQEDA